MPASTLRLLLLPTLYCGALLAACPAMAAPPGPASPAPASCTGLLRQDFLRLQDEKPQSLCQYSGKVVVVVNTASFCGFTPQYQGWKRCTPSTRTRPGGAGLSFQRFRAGNRQQQGDRGLLREHLRGEIPDVHQNRVTGKDANPLFKQLAAKTGTTPRWNFYKYVIARDGSQRHELQLEGRPIQPAFPSQRSKSSLQFADPQNWQSFGRGRPLSLTKIYLSNLSPGELPGIRALILTCAQFALARQAAQAKNSFIVAKPSGPSRFSCNPGALLLLPPSLVRAGALRSIFIFPAGKAPPHERRVLRFSGLRIRTLPDLLRNTDLLDCKLKPCPRRPARRTVPKRTRCDTA
jgi:glutathione peroxidase